MSDQLNYWSKRRTEDRVQLDALKSGYVTIRTVVANQVVGSCNPAMIANLEATLDTYDSIIAELQGNNA